MGRPRIPDFRRKSSTPHYQTFPTPPPKSKGPPPSDTSSNDGYRRANSRSPITQHHTHDSSTHLLSHEGEGSPLPIRQLCVLAIISLSEQTALNSIGPYLPQMVSSFPDVDVGQVGLYVGTIASSFAIAQFATNFFWGWLSDRIGRKPVILLGTFFTAACFVAFGFVQTFWQAVLVQVLMGLVNGNQGVVSTCLGEITDRSNQSRAFIYLPVIYGLGGITGPVVGGLLVHRQAHFSSTTRFPFLRPNILSGAILLLDLVVCMIWLEESLAEARALPPLGKRVGNIFAWVWQFASSSRPSYLRVPEITRRGSRRTRHRSFDGSASDDIFAHENGSTDSTDTDGDSVSTLDSLPDLIPQTNSSFSKSHIFSKDLIILLTSYLIFQLSNISYNSLYPIFGQAQPPQGRGLSPSEIGFSLAFAGAMTIVFQLGVFGKLRDHLGNKISYQGCIAGLALAFFLTPWVSFEEDIQGHSALLTGRTWLYIELGAILLLKSLAAVGCLTSFLLLITNAAPDHSVLGSLNGLAQTLSAAGRAVGPFLAGGLFSLSLRLKSRGEVLAFSAFGAIAFVGFLLSLAVHSKGLEAQGSNEEEGRVGMDGADDDDDDRSQAAD